jgi:hypothetical protein
VVLETPTSRLIVEGTVAMAHNNEDLGESEKGAVEITAQETDVGTVVNKESLSSHEGHGSEAPSAAAAQTDALPRDPASEPPSEAPIEVAGASGRPYSVFTVTQKKMIILTASLASLFSPMATAIYCELSPPSLWRNTFSHNQIHLSQPWPKTSTSQTPKST